MKKSLSMSMGKCWEGRKGERLLQFFDALYHREWRFMVMNKQINLS